MIRLTRAQVREVDRLAVEKYGMPSIVLMENAARAAATVAWEMLDYQDAASVLVFCGTGNNGGDGYALARHMHNFGCRVECLGESKTLKGDALINFRVAEAMNLMFNSPSPIFFDNYDLIIDALFGTGLNKSPTGEFDRAIDEMNQAGIPILAIDIPSGLDCDSGAPLGNCVKATKTITFVAEKIGFASPESRQYTGEVIVGDIGCPRELIDEVLGLQSSS